MSDQNAGAVRNTAGNSGRQPGGARSGSAGAAASVRYWVCVAILGLSAAGMNAAAAFLGAYFQKEPVPLKKSIVAIDTAKLRPRYEKHPIPMRQPSEEELDSLGTKEFVQLVLVDTTKPPNDATRVAHVMLTYYTGKPDLVPHVPDECYLAGGYQKSSSRDVRLDVANVEAEDGVPLRVLEFRARSTGIGPDQTQTICYCFHSNGRYATTRHQVRVLQSSILQRYAYYAKIEFKFSNERDSAMSVLFSKFASPEESIAAAPDLVAALMPVLFNDHFSWRELNE
jgi:hypothetical protein